jgi:hypothetical protein
MYLINNIDQMHQSFNKSKTWIVSSNKMVYSTKYRSQGLNINYLHRNQLLFDRETNLIVDKIIKLKKPRDIIFPFYLIN